MNMSDAKLGVWDFVAIAGYFVAVISAGLYAMCQSNRSTINGYFLAGRFMTWLPVGASLFASNIGTEHFIGLAGSGAAAGVAVGAFELNACFLLQLLGWVFLPVYIASGARTLPEYMKKRFGGRRIRIYLATLSLALYIFTKISVNLYSGALFINQALHWNIYVSIILLLALTAVTTVTGGLTAVIYTDTLQALVMVIGAVVLAVLSFIRVGGYKELYHRYMSAVPITSLFSNDTCGYPQKDSWFMLREPFSSDMPWPGFLFGQTVASIWYWCADQMMVQRTLAARSLSHAQGGTLFAGFLKLLPIFLLVLPGMISRVLFTDEVACADPDICWNVCENRHGCSNIAYPKLVLALMPTGMKGIMLSVMLAALMSDLTSVFNSASTLFTIDIYQYFRVKAHTRELMVVGRIFVGVMVVIGIVWIPVIQGMQGAQLYTYIQAISAYLAPPVACVYLLAIIWRRGNEQGAFCGLMVGLVLGVVRMTLDFIYPEPRCGVFDERPLFISKFHYMYFALVLFGATGLTMISVSLASAAPPSQQIVRTTYWSRHDRSSRDDETASHMRTVCGSLPATETLTSIFTSGDAEMTLLAPDNVVASCNKDLRPQLDENSAQILEPACSSWLKEAWKWLCGLDASEMSSCKKDLENEAQLNDLKTLSQSPQERATLCCILVILFALDISLYVFFSTGSDFGLLRDSSHNYSNFSLFNNSTVLSNLNILTPR